MWHGRPRPQRVASRQYPRLAWRARAPGGARRELPAGLGVVEGELARRGSGSGLYTRAARPARAAVSLGTCPQTSATLPRASCPQSLPTQELGKSQPPREFVPTY